MLEYYFGTPHNKHGSNGLALAALPANLNRQITPGHHPPTRRAKGEWWAAIEVTPDIELRARGLDGGDLAALESIADAFRALLSRDF